MKKRLTLFILILALTGLTTAVVLLHHSRPKLAYVELSKIYNDFEMKKELEKEMTSVQDMRKRTLDSLELGLNMLGRTMQNFEVSGNRKGVEERMPEFEMRRQEFLQKREAFSEDNEAMSQQYAERIWKQINQYVKDFGKENGYTYIFGADGTGALMYGEEAADITAEVAKYVNERYKGKGVAK